MPRPDRWLWLGLALLAVGVGVRVALYFPLAMYQFDSDAVLSGLCAFRIAAGHYTAFFPGGSRLGAASCYIAAAYFRLFGWGRVGLALTGLTWSTLYLVFSLLFLRTMLNAKVACAAYLFAVFPSEQFMTTTYAPWGYGEIMASCAATLWLAARWRREGALWQRIGCGFSVGLGLWFSLQTLMIALPAVVWIALGRQARMANEAVEALPAALIGAAPLLVGNVDSGFSTFTHNWASHPVASVPGFFDNLIWLLTYMLPKLLFRSSSWISETTLLMGAYAVVTVAFVRAARRTACGDAVQLIILTIIACVFIFSASSAGSVRGWTVRYIAPLYLVVPLFCGIGVAALWRWSRGLAALCAAVLIGANVAYYGLPGSPLRADLTTQLRDDERLRTLLAQHGVRMVYGNYVWVYHLNFDTHTEIAAVPFAADDYLNYGAGLGTQPVRWAAMGNLDEIRGWSRAAGARGSVTMDGPLYVFIAGQAAPNAAQLIAALRRAT